MKKAILLVLLTSSVAFSQVPGCYSDLYNQLDDNLSDIDGDPS